MFNNQFGNNYNPFGYQQAGSNVLYVGGADDVARQFVPANSSYIFIDNKDNNIIYEKITDNRGRFEVRTFKKVAYEPAKEQEQSIDLTNYVKLSDFKELQSKIKSIEEKLSKPVGSITNGTTK